MGWPLTDITLYTPTKCVVRTREFYAEKGILNYMTDLYMQKMNGYVGGKSTKVDGSKIV